MFEKLGQSPWYAGGDDQFIQHLDKLKDCAHFKREITDNIEGNMHTDLETGAFVSE